MLRTTFFMIVNHFLGLQPITQLKSIVGFYLKKIA